MLIVFVSAQATQAQDNGGGWRWNPGEIPPGSRLWLARHDATDQRIELTSDCEITHERLGIRPYSAFAGALAVAEEIRIQLRLSAERAASL